MSLANGTRTKWQVTEWEHTLEGAITYAEKAAKADKAKPTSVSVVFAINNGQTKISTERKRTLTGISQIPKWVHERLEKHPLFQQEVMSYKIRYGKPVVLKANGQRTDRAGWGKLIGPDQWDQMLGTAFKKWMCWEDRFPNIVEVFNHAQEVLHEPARLPCANTQEVPPLFKARFTDFLRGVYKYWVTPAYPNLIQVETTVPVNPEKFIKEVPFELLERAYFSRKHHDEQMRTDALIEVLNGLQKATTHNILPKVDEYLARIKAPPPVVIPQTPRQPKFLFIGVRQHDIQGIKDKLVEIGKADQVHLEFIPAGDRRSTISSSFTLVFGLRWSNLDLQREAEEKYKDLKAFIWCSSISDFGQKVLDWFSRQRQ